MGLEINRPATKVTRINAYTAVEPRIAITWAPEGTRRGKPKTTCTWRPTVEKERRKGGLAGNHGRKKEVLWQTEKTGSALWRPYNVTPSHEVNKSGACIFHNTFSVGDYYR